MIILLLELLKFTARRKLYYLIMGHFENKGSCFQHPKQNNLKLKTINTFGIIRKTKK